VISGFFDPKSTRPVPRVRVTLFLPGISIDPAPVDFLVDTGASTTCLHPRDAVKAMGISAARLLHPDQWPQHRSAAGVGGSSLYYVVPARYAFLHEDGRRDVHLGELAIAQLRHDNLTLPSLLGWDLLQHFRIIAEWASRQITLETV
jgi:hypothetical protein